MLIEFIFIPKFWSRFSFYLVVDACASESKSPLRGDLIVRRGCCDFGKVGHAMLGDTLEP